MGETWKNSLGLKTQVNQQQYLDLNIVQYDLGGGFNTFWDYSNPGFNLFGRLLEYASVFGKKIDLPGDNLSYFRFGNEKTFDLVKFFTLNEFSQRPMVLKNGNSLDEFLCGSFDNTIYVGKVIDEEFRIRSNNNKYNFRFGVDDVSRLIKEIYSQSPCDVFNEIYEKIVNKN